jgi:multidrug efflux pump subunit AcrB
VQDLQIGDDEVTVRVMLPASERRNLEDLGRLWIGLPDGGRIPLSEAATFSTDRGYASLARVDGKRAATIKAEVDDSKANVAQLTTGIRGATADIGERFPGVTLSFEGARKQTRESTGSLQYLFPIALLVIYVIIAVLFRSYIQPVIVMSIIPFALIGAIGGHAIMGFPLTLLSMLGIVALAGIVVNDGLLLVDLCNRKRREGLPLHEAVIAGARGRMRPILLTSITTCAGLAPIMLETSFQAQFLIPMAVSIVFGLAFATGLILVLLPVFYVIMEDQRASLRWLFGRPWKHYLPHDPGVDLDADHT